MSCSIVFRPIIKWWFTFTAAQIADGLKDNKEFNKK